MLRQHLQLAVPLVGIVVLATLSLRYISIEGYYSAGLGAKYNVTENWAVSAGGKYLWFGDAKGQLPTKQIVGDFQDNDGYIFGVKLSYQDTK